MRNFRIYNPELLSVSDQAIGLEYISMDYVTIRAEQVGDEYHTMHELYQHRMALNIFLFKMMYRLDKQVRGPEADTNPYIVKSKLHHDGTMFEGYFIVIAYTNEGQISYHYKLKHWDKFKIPELPQLTREYDGHGSLEVMERLMRL